MCEIIDHWIKQCSSNCWRRGHRNRQDVTFSVLMRNNRNRTKVANGREFYWGVIESRNRRSWWCGNGDIECIRSGNMTWIIVMNKNIETIYKWTYSDILFVWTRSDDSVLVDEMIDIARETVNILNNRS